MASEAATLLPSPMKATVRPATEPKRLDDGQHVGHRLERMLAVGQAVDDGHGGAGGEVADRLVAQRAGDDGGDPGAQRAADVVGRLAPPDADIAAEEVDRLAAELADGELGADPRAQRGVLEDERHGAAPQRLAGVAPGGLPLGLERGGQLEQPRQASGSRSAAEKRSRPRRAAERRGRVGCRGGHRPATGRSG